MGDMMPKEDYDITEITRLLIKMRDACLRKNGDAHDDLEMRAKYYALEDALDLINNPSLLVRHGRWKQVQPKGIYNGRLNLTPKVICTECKKAPKMIERNDCDMGANMTLREWHETLWCPNCGAKMDKED